MDNDEPIFYDGKFRQKRKHGVWREVEAPVIEGPVADTHAHLQMLRDPALELARCAMHGVAFVETIVDPADDGFGAFEALPGWLMEASADLRAMMAAEGTAEGTGGKERRALPPLPAVRIAAGVHPHNAKDLTDDLVAALGERLRDRRVSAVA